ncbi:MAG: ATP-binding cassette domain-containing protein, partial [Bryobacterales bacterium]|nr:ATP-binding cassette domain-containing protein [Bryobacterales bacterium]
MRDQSVPIVELHQISKRFPGVQALDAVNLKIFPGQVHAILGENGAGKTTLINVLVGELQPDDGEIIYEGERVEISSPHRSRQLGISVVYQELALCLNLSVAENIALNTVSNKSALS